MISSIGKFFISVLLGVISLFPGHATPSPLQPVASSTQDIPPSSTSTPKIIQNGTVQTSVSIGTKNTAQPAVIKNCGSNVVCASSVFINCSPAVFTQTNSTSDASQTYSYRIGIRQGSYCPVTLEINNPPVTKTCNIPISIISDLTRSMTINPQYAVTQIGLLFISGQYLVQTGNTMSTISFDCTPSGVLML
jgi:hypothetical protein